MDITKDRPQHILLSFDEEGILVGKWQLIQYEDISDYCGYCKHQGHAISNCMIKRWEDEAKKRKDMEEAAKQQNKGETNGENPNIKK